MKIDKDGFYSDFCCARFEIHSRKPDRALVIDPEGPKVRVFRLQSGIAVTTGTSGTAGNEIGPTIDYCPWCGVEITFERE